MLELTGLNWLAILVATLVGFALGGIWYGPVFGDAWLAALGKTADQIQPSATPFVISFFTSPGHGGRTRDVHQRFEYIDPGRRCNDRAPRGHRLHRHGDGFGQRVRRHGAETVVDPVRLPCALQRADGRDSRRLAVGGRHGKHLMDLDALRREYVFGSLDEQDLNTDPFRQFDTWFGNAVDAGIELADVMTVATASQAGVPSARIVVLRGVDERGFVFYTDYRSAKSRDLDENPSAALVFYWRELGRQVRISGAVQRVSEEESARYFQVQTPGKPPGGPGLEPKRSHIQSEGAGRPLRGTEGGTPHGRRALSRQLGRVPRFAP